MFAEKQITTSQSEILNQWNSPTCMNFAICAILARRGVSFDLNDVWYEQRINIAWIEKLFVEKGLIKKLVKLPTPKLVDLWLNKWEWIYTSTFRWDFTIEDNEWNIVEFDWTAQHAFVLTKDCWDKWEMQNSWWPTWNWNGKSFIKKTDFKYLTTPLRIWIDK